MVYNFTSAKTKISMLKNVNLGIIFHAQAIIYWNAEEHIIN